MIMFVIFSLIPLTFGVETVKYAAVIFRHGDRTPVETYPTDPWRNESMWPVKFGELTNTGKKQHYALGQWFRRRYSHLLSEDFDPSEIYVRSTDVDRTLMSVQANLAGMYPPVGKAVWDSHLLWQPIPIHTTPEKEDEVLAMKKRCKAYDSEMKKFTHSDAFIKRLRKYQDLMDYLTTHTGKNIKDYNDIGNIYSTLYIETLYNFTLPNWTQSVYPDKLREPACYSFTTSAATSLLARLRAGPLIKEIMSKVNKSITENNTKSLKLSVYSGHDFTVATLLNALGMFDGNCPVYTSTILFELIYDSSTSSHHITISYRNFTEILEPYVLTIPFCGKKCPVEKFMRLYENLLTVDFDYDCGNKFPALLGISFFIGLEIFAIICVAHKICFARVTRQQRFHIGYSKLDPAVQTTNKVIQI